MREILDKEVDPQRLQSTLLGTFAALALLLAGVGLYGWLAWIVAQQSSEIGLRIALGAEPNAVFSRIVGRTLRLTAFGVAAGIVASLAASRLLTSLLFGVAPNDPATYVAVGVLLLLTAAIASYIPGKRAISVDPLIALRQE